MIYDNLKEICRVNKISLVSICREIGISQSGLKKGMCNGSLAIRFILPLCESIHISPNKLFGIEDGKNYINQTQIGGNNNVQQVTSSEYFKLLDDYQDKCSQLSRAERRVDELLKLLAEK